jgi:hypothetical protein
VSDWQAGDLALCVDARRNPGVARVSPIQEGGVYRVAGVQRLGCAHALYGTSDCSLFLEGLLSEALTGAFAAARFRKIRPDEHEACEAEFVTLLNRSKVPAKVGFDEGVSQ